MAGKGILNEPGFVYFNANRSKDVLELNKDEVVVSKIGRNLNISSMKSLPKSSLQNIDIKP